MMSKHEEETIQRYERISLLLQATDQGNNHLTIFLR